MVAEEGRADVVRLGRMLLRLVQAGHEHCVPTECGFAEARALVQEIAPSLLTGAAGAKPGGGSNSDGGPKEPGPGVMDAIGLYDGEEARRHAEELAAKYLQPAGTPRPGAPEDALAEKLFNAYNGQGPNPWRTFDGRPVPKWGALSDQVVEKWRAVARVVSGPIRIVVPPSEVAWASFREDIQKGDATAMVITSVQDGGPNLVDRTLALLNEALRLSPEAISGLTLLRRACSRKLADHPTIEVAAHADGFSVGMLGIINGILRDGVLVAGPIAAMVDTENNRVVGFKRYVEPGVQTSALHQGSGE